MSDDFQTQISKLVEQFVGQVTTIARAAAMETLNSALGMKGGGLATRSARAATARSTGTRVKGEKRPHAELEKTRERLLAFVGDNPGLRVEQINKALSTTTRDVALPLRKLLAEGALRTEGVKRSTQYFPGDGKQKASAASPRRRKKR